MGRILLSLCLLSVSVWSQTITVTSPGAGVVWKQGETRMIQWTKEGNSGANVRIVLRAPGQTAPVLEIADTAPNSGSFSWTIPATVPAGAYVIRVRSISNNQIQDDSGQFQIQAKSGHLPFPFITIQEPSEGDVWTRSASHMIKWKSVNVSASSMRISLMDESLANAVHLIAGSAPNSGSFTWQIPDAVANGTYRVRVATADGSKSRDSGSFKIGASMAGSSAKAKLAAPALVKIDVNFPPEGTHMNIGEGMIVRWETKVPGPYFIDLMSEDGHTLITHLCENAGNNIGGDKWIQGNIHPEINTQVTIATGLYRFKVRGGTYGSGLGPKVHITGPQVEVLEQLLGSYHDRHSRRRLNDYPELDPDPSVSFSSPDKARVGGDFRVDIRDHEWIGFIFRSQVIFPIEQINMAGHKTLKDAWIYIQETTERSGRIGDSCGVEPYPMPTARGWKVYGLTGPWSGPCIETPGYEVGEIPSHVNETTIHITDLVKGWLDGSKPNHGLIIGSRFEPFPEWNCFLAMSWYKITLNMKFMKDKAN